MVLISAFPIFRAHLFSCSIPVSSIRKNQFRVIRVVKADFLKAVREAVA